MNKIENIEVDNCSDCPFCNSDSEYGNSCNIADIGDHVNHLPAELGEQDDYLVRFERVDLANNKLNMLLENVKHQPHDEARIQLLLKCIAAQSSVNSEMYDLLVEMNNYFGADHN